MNCPKCDTANEGGARFCAECGASLGSGQEVDGGSRVPEHDGTRDSFGRPGMVYPRNPPITPHLCWVNVAVTGLAQMVHGQVAKGLLLLIMFFASNLVLPFILAIVIGIISIVDAYKVGATLKKGKPVGKWEWFPGD